MALSLPIRILRWLLSHLKLLSKCPALPSATQCWSTCHYYINNSASQPSHLLLCIVPIYGKLLIMTLSCRSLLADALASFHYFLCLLPVLAKGTTISTSSSNHDFAKCKDPIHHYSRQRRSWLPVYPAGGKRDIKKYKLAKEFTVQQTVTSLCMKSNRMSAIIFCWSSSVIYLIQCHWTFTCTCALSGRLLLLVSLIEGNLCMF